MKVGRMFGRRIRLILAWERPYADVTCLQARLAGKFRAECHGRKKRERMSYSTYLGIVSERVGMSARWAIR